MWGDIRGDAARPPGKRRVAALRARASGQGQGEGSVVRVRVGLQAAARSPCAAADDRSALAPSLG